MESFKNSDSLEDLLLQRSDNYLDKDIPELLGGLSDVQKLVLTHLLKENIRYKQRLNHKDKYIREIMDSHRENLESILWTTRNLINTLSEN